MKLRRITVFAVAFSGAVLAHTAAIAQTINPFSSITDFQRAAASGLLMDPVPLSGVPVPGPSGTTPPVAPFVSPTPSNPALSSVPGTPNLNAVPVDEFTIGPATIYSTNLVKTSDGAFGTGAYLQSLNAPVEITLSGTDTAFGLTLGTNSGIAGVFSVYVNGVFADDVATPGAPGTGFIGFTDTAPITDVEISQPNGAGTIDLISFDVGTALVPEPARTGLFATAVAGLLALRRRRA